MELEPFAEIILTTNVNLGITLTFTINSSIPGYSVTGDIPVRGNSARLQLTILSYQLTDSDSSLACVVTHAVSGSSYTAASSRTPALSGNGIVVFQPLSYYKYLLYGSICRNRSHEIL